MTYSRAGHCPMLLVPARRGSVLPPVKVLAPDGLVVGLKIDDGTLFESLLEEMTVPLVVGDLFVLFTDGMSEMMNLSTTASARRRLGELAGVYRAPAARPAGRRHWCARCGRSAPAPASTTT